jgi:hypothetical protein
MIEAKEAYRRGFDLLDHPSIESKERAKIIGIYSGLAVDENGEFVEYCVKFSDGSQEIVGVQRITCADTQPQSETPPLAGHRVSS